MSSDKSGLTSSKKGGIPQLHTTAGNIVHPVQGLANDAGAGKPPDPEGYGAVEDGSISAGAKFPSGNSKAMNAWFGSSNPGGGKK